MDPFTKHPTLEVHCFVRDPVTGEMYTRDPRYIARKAELYLKQTGIADTSYWGPESEFYIFDSVRFDQNQHEGYYHIDAVEGVWNSGRERRAESEPRLQAPVQGGVLPAPADGPLPGPAHRDGPQPAEGGHRRRGAPPRGGHRRPGRDRHPLRHAAGHGGQRHEVQVRRQEHCWRQAGKTVTFMPKPIFMDNGSGMHTHQSLWKEGENLFWDEVGYAGLSDTARWYIGGLLAHAPALLAFAAPTTNSYRRLVPGYEAPINLVYSQRNRWACDRIPMYYKTPGRQARGVPHARPHLQPVPRVRRDAPGGARRDQEQDRAAGPDRQGPVRPAARGGRPGQAGPRVAGGGAGRPGDRPSASCSRAACSPRTSSTPGSSTSGSTGSTGPAPAAPPRVRYLYYDI